MCADSTDDSQFHDNAIHGISFVTEDFRSDLCLDIDHIIQWPTCAAVENKDPVFTISKAVLTFHDVTDLVINIDWGASGYTTSVSGFYIVSIEKEKIDTPLRFLEYYKWQVITNQLRSKLTFGASGMSLNLVGAPISVNRQYLKEIERRC